MNQLDRKISVIGDGGWGTALTVLLSHKGYQVKMWGSFEQHIETLRRTRRNDKFLPGIKVPSNVSFTTDMDEALAHANRVVVLAVPSQYMRSVARKIHTKSPNKIFVSVAKGIETSTLKVMSQVVREELGRVKIAVLSGPTIAREVAQNMPAAVSVASTNPAVASLVRKVFETKTFRVFESTDMLGVELGGSLKNVIAIGSGIVEGLGFGSNTQAAFFARGVAEMARLGEAMGAKRETFMGLSGLGDLATTCLSRHSRNRTLGEAIGRGKKLADILKKTHMVVEGVETARSTYALSKKYKISMPITEAVHGILFKRQDPRQAVVALMSTRFKRETD